jgi:dienelactone hydrolase
MPRLILLSSLLLLGLASDASQPAAPVTMADVLPGTKPLEFQGDPAAFMLDGMHKFLNRETQLSVERRARHWKRDTSSPEAYTKSVEPNRERLRKIIGAVDPRPQTPVMEYVATTDQPALIGKGEGFEVYVVRWRAFGDVYGEGLLLKPTGRDPLADVIAIPDADQLPEQLVGLVPGIPPESQFARRLAESGCRVIVPFLIDRKDTYSGLEKGRMTNQPHREWIYRQAFEMGRHIIGYEVQKVLAAVDWFDHEQNQKKSRSIQVYGYGEGGQLALLSGALDTRIKETHVSGYFANRESLWREPIYRNTWGRLDEFGDAEIASMICSRKLMVDMHSAKEQLTGHGPVDQFTGKEMPGDHIPGGPYLDAPGVRYPPLVGDVEKEIERAKQLTKGLRIEGDYIARMYSIHGLLGLFVYTLDVPLRQAPTTELLTKGTLIDGRSEQTRAIHLRASFDPSPRLKRQFDQLQEHTQKLLHEAEYTRREFWAKAVRKSRSVEKWQQSAEWYRDYFAKEVIGQFDIPLSPANVRTRKVYDEPKYVGYEVMMDVFPDVIGHGLLLVPKDIQPGEKRPCVVCQHGLEGRPQDVADPKKDHPAYHRYGCQLAERGFVVYAPQNPYIFGDRFRSLQRKLNPLKKTLFSLIVPQHRQATDWLASLPFVDGDRIAFYGLSYGGKTAMRVPPLVPRYCAVICSADFNEWIWKNTSNRSPYSYLASGEYEIFEWDLGNTFNYAEMAGLIAPRPFMVERGHGDTVAPDEWVAYEFAKVKRLYVDLGIGDRARIEFFDGPHTINGKGTFDFLHEHLKWPKR